MDLDNFSHFQKTIYYDFQNKIMKELLTYSAIDGEKRFYLNFKRLLRKDFEKLLRTP